MRDGIDGVINEFWIMSKALRVLNHQGLLGDYIVQVVHQECCQSIVSAKLSALGQSLVGLGLIDVHADVAADRAQKIMILEIEAGDGAWFLQHHEMIVSFLFPDLVFELDGS